MQPEVLEPLSITPPAALEGLPAFGFVSGPHNGIELTMARDAQRRAIFKNLVIRHLLFSSRGRTLAAETTSCIVARQADYA
jgi:hypothetical protein